MKHHNYFETLMCTLWPKVISAGNSKSLNKLDLVKDIVFNLSQRYQNTQFSKKSIINLSCLALTCLTKTVN